MTARALRIAGRPRVADRRALGWLGLAVAAIAIYVVFRGQWTIPHDNDAPAFGAFNDLRDWVGDVRRDVAVVGIVLGAIRESSTWLAESMIEVLIGIGWLGVLASATALGWLSGGWRTAALALGGLGVVALLGLWELAMQTLGLTLAAVLMSLSIGIPLGILTGKRNRIRALVAPILDALQIMPQFAYLVPFVILFQIGPGAAAIVTMVYAVPATIRITALAIRGVPATAIEAATSLGATGGQTMRKVELPLARSTIALAVNQTIMLALSMVVITALINGPGLGVTILRAVQVTNVGAALEAGVAIVLIAIVLDRVTERASERLDARRRAGGGSGARLARIVGVGLVVAAIGGAALALTGSLPAEVPDELATLTFREPVNDAVAFIRTNFVFLTDTLKEGFTAAILDPLQGVLVSSPFWLVIAVATGIALFVSGARAALVTAVCIGGTVILQLWDHSMRTLALVVVAGAITMLVGAVLGIAAALSDRFSRGLRPFLDIAQTLPAFVYLLPAIALFEPSRFTALAGAVIFAVPPVARLVEAGIRVVPSTTIEAARSAGASRGQLLRKVQLPIARPALLLAANQGIVMVLGMVVLGGLVGGGALGFDVVSGFSQRNDFGMGFAAGLCMVLLGIALDRMTQGAGRHRIDGRAGSGGRGTIAADEEAADPAATTDEAPAPA